jgi:heat shock protein HtpX
MRILLFLATNLAIMVVVGIVMRVLGLQSYLTPYGLDYNSLMVFCLLWGMGFSLASLFLSKTMAKMTMRLHMIEAPTNPDERWIFETVRELSEKASIGMPEVAIIPSGQPNAFATGWNRNNALVAVSAGLLQNMKRNEVRAVIGHEIGHVANGDMITLSLVQGVVNAFVMFFARVVGSFVDRVIFKNENGHGIGFFITTIVCEIVFGILASAIVMWFSRQREFRADEAGASLADRQSMVGALQALQRFQNQPSDMPDSMVAFGINGGLKEGLQKMFMSHPPLEERIAALQHSRVIN